MCTASVSRLREASTYYAYSKTRKHRKKRMRNNKRNNERSLVLALRSNGLERLASQGALDGGYSADAEEQDRKEHEERDEENAQRRSLPGVCNIVNCG